MLFHIKHNWWDNGLRTVTATVDDDFEKPFLKRENQFIQFLDKRIILLDKSYKPLELDNRLKADLIILSKNAKVKVDDLVSAFEFEQIIFDSSNSTRKVSYWKKDCERLGLAYYDVSESGAYILTM